MSVEFLLNLIAFEQIPILERAGHWSEVKKNLSGDGSPSRNASSRDRQTKAASGSPRTPHPLTQSLFAPYGTIVLVDGTQSSEVFFSARSTVPNWLVALTFGGVTIFGPFTL